LSMFANFCASASTGFVISGVSVRYCLVSFATSSATIWMPLSSKIFNMPGASARMPLTRTRAVRVLFGPAKSSAVSSFTIAVCSSGSMNHALLNTSLLSAAVMSAFAAASENALMAALCSLYTLMDSARANSENCAPVATVRSLMTLS